MKEEELFWQSFCSVLKKAGYNPASPVNVPDEIYLRDNFFGWRFDIL